MDSSIANAPRLRFIGRQVDLAAVEGHFQRGARLVTVAGPAGMGKTRLAQELLRRAASEGRAGGVFADLTEARSLDDACASTARALDFALTSRQGDFLQALGSALAGRGPLLLVLDNLEQIAAPMAGALSRWLQAAPEACFLVTSRERLRLDAEVVHELPPLGVPDEGGEVLATEAVQLFVDRAMLARPSFAASPGDAALLAELARRLDGSPLAIELAAARMGLMTLPQLVAHLPQRFKLIAHGPATLADRQRTLRAAIDWSWELLEPPEQAALAQLSVFRGGFDLAAAEAVVDLSSVQGAPWVVDVLQRLKDKSLLRAGEGPSGTDELRLGLYESIREYAAEKLEHLRGGDAARGRHAAHFLSVFEEAGERAYGPGGVALLKALDREQHNLMAVVNAAKEGSAERARDGLRALLSLDPLFFLRGPFRVHLELIESAMSHSAFAELDDALEARAHHARGRARERAGDPEGSAADFRAGMMLARKAGDRRLEGAIRGSEGHLHHNQGRLAEAKRTFEEALAIHREVGNRRLEGTVLSNLGLVLQLNGHLEQAREHYTRALAIHREVGDRRSEAVTMSALGGVPHALGQLEEARRLYEEALGMHREVGARRSEGVALVNLGLILQEQGKLEAAAVALSQAMEVHRSIGDAQTEAIARGYVGIIRHEQNRPAEARLLLDEALAQNRKLGNRRFEGLMLAHLGSLAAPAGELSKAAALLDEADATLQAAQEGVFLSVTGLLRGVLDVRRYLSGAEKGDASAAAHLERARARLPKDGAASLRSDEARCALRLLQRALSEARPESLVETAPDAEKAPAQALVVGPEASWFRPPGKRKVVDLSNRRVLKLLLRALADLRSLAPGKAMALDSLFAAGWPGEKVAPDVLANRVFVSLTSLRKLGLREVLLKTAEGYLLDPEVRLVRVAAKEQ